MDGNRIKYYPEGVTDTEAAEIFKKEWTRDFKYRLDLHHNGMQSIAGYGTTIDAVTPILLEFPKIFVEYDIKIFLDIPCGDYHIMRNVDFEGVQYIGADIVNEQIAWNIEKYPNIDFSVLNMVTDKLPYADLVFSRDILIHLSNNDINKFIKNCNNSKCKYLMATTYTKINKNEELGGVLGWRHINLEKFPFNFPPPLKLISESSDVEIGKSMGIWKISDLVKIIQ